MALTYQKGSKIISGVIEGSTRERILKRAGFVLMKQSPDTVPELPSKTDAPVHPVSNEDAPTTDQESPEVTPAETISNAAEDQAKLEALSDDQLMTLIIELDLPQPETREAGIQSVLSKVGTGETKPLDELIANATTE